MIDDAHTLSISRRLAVGGRVWATLELRRGFLLAWSLHAMQSMRRYLLFRPPAIPIRFQLSKANLGSDDKTPKSLPFMAHMKCQPHSTRDGGRCL